MKNRIVVVGGYGHVGKTICRELGAQYPRLVYAAGRNLASAEKFSRETGGSVLPMQLDIGQEVAASVFDQVKLVIMCLDQTDTAFVRACFRSGTHYIDVSADGRFLNQVEYWTAEAEANDATAVLSVGLAPGLTNLLARQTHNLLDHTKSLELAIMLGLGDQHGKAAIEWTVDNLSVNFPITQNARQITVDSFTDGKTIDFGAHLGRKRAYRFPFSDQQTLPRTLNVPSVSTRLCFDSKLATAFMAGLRATGTFRFLKFKGIRNATVRGFSKLHFGVDKFALKVEAHGEKGGKQTTVACLLQGSDQSQMTARVASYVADAVYSSKFPHGVYHIDQLFELTSLSDKVLKDAHIEMFVNGESAIQAY
ncbi:saccharopine dehydrogenase NADP-binding domain-containing protein [Paenibacillus sp. HWE-109]|uniref:saccharopine dehydrogenase family protein n=1 Tax=Paenibacillus sp. HWE-109 TaxID=1306526 RepID=UPI001EDCF586|nr:saccharopine dehydrogenase NADP-binding domain-containing protein [Paenibacillus sp. HWE-109]UKS25187.1 saccharopine dehydrogenase NADP-binding domain-containing protein [Paenibacillus sp. HWE-109]